MAEGFASPGKVDIQELTLYTITGPVNMVSFMLELNLYEDMYASGLYGNMIVHDSIGLIHRLSMIGEEFLTVKFDVPGFNNPIHKTFKCYRISDRTFKNDNSSETYVIHFTSPEVIVDQTSVVQKSFSGKTTDIIVDLFTNYLMTPRNLVLSPEGRPMDSENFTELSTFTPIETEIKFISPSWSPIHCINWVAAKSTLDSAELNAPNMFFFESSRRFYWASMEDLIKTQYEAQAVSGVYVYAPANVKTSSPSESTVTLDNRVYSAPDIPREYFSIHNIEIVNNIDSLSNIQTGYLGSVYHELDIGTRKYTEIPYDHIESFPKQFRMAGQKSNSFFASNAVTNPYNHQIVGFKHPGLFDGAKNNLNERAASTLPKRLSNLIDLEQIKVKMDVLGRTDMEVGSMIYIHYPKSGPRDEEDKNKSIKDQYYSGMYIITAIHHKVNQETYHSTMEAVKDSWGDVQEGTATT